MNITNYIVEFLKQGNPVEIKGIGTFSSKTTPSYFDEETKKYFPSVRTVVFSNSWKGDTQIINYIAKQEFIGITTAEKLWDNFVSALIDKMKAENKHEFPELGELVLDNENGYSFKIFEGVNFSKETKNMLPLNDVTVFSLDPLRNNPFERFDNPVIPQPEEPIVEEIASAEETTEENTEQATEQISEEEANGTEEIHSFDPEIVVPEKETTEENNVAVEEEPIVATTLTEENNNIATETAAVEDNNDTTEETPQAEENSVVENTETTDENKEVKKEKKKKKKLLLPIILGLLLLLLGGAYYYFIIIKDTYVPFINENVQLAEENVSETDVTANVSDTTTAEQDATIVDGETEEQLEVFKNVNLFTYDYTLVPISDKENTITATCNTIVNNLDYKIENFLKKQHYTTAKEPIKERLNEYIVKRLKVIFDDDFFHPARLMNYDDYISEHCSDYMERQRVSRAKTEIISEINADNLLLEFLNELIDAGAVKKDKIVVPAPKPKVVPKADIRLRSKQGYDIISGFFKSRENAIREADRFRRRGADAYIVAKGNMYYVSLGSAPSMTAAEALLRQLKTWNKENMVIKKW